MATNVELYLHLTVPDEREAAVIAQAVRTFGATVWTPEELARALRRPDRPEELEALAVALGLDPRDTYNPGP